MQGGKRRPMVERGDEVVLLCVVITERRQDERLEANRIKVCVRLCVGMCGETDG